MDNETPYTEGIEPVKIELPQALITFYSQRSIHLRKLPSYELVEGKGALEPCEDAFNVYGVPCVLSYPIKYESRESELKATARSAQLIFNLYKVNDKISRIKLRDVEISEKEYMVNARTRPIRIRSNVRGSKKTVYVKKPSAARIFGNAFYNIISGHEENVFVFNPYVFVEDETEGFLVDEKNKSRLLESEKFIHSLIKADVHDWFLSINDMDNYRNFVVDNNYTAKVIDFDCMFFKRKDERSLLEFLAEEEGIEIDVKTAESVRCGERRDIRRRIVRNKKQFENLVELMNQIPEFNHQARMLYGAKDVEEYFAARFEELDA